MRTCTLCSVPATTPTSMLLRLTSEKPGRLTLPRSSPSTCCVACCGGMQRPSMWTRRATDEPCLANPQVDFEKDKAKLPRFMHYIAGPAQFLQKYATAPIRGFGVLSIPVRKILRLLPPRHHEPQRNCCEHVRDCAQMPYSQARFPMVAGSPRRRPCVSPRRVPTGTSTRHRSEA